MVKLTNGIIDSITVNTQFEQETDVIISVNNIDILNQSMYNDSVSIDIPQLELNVITEISIKYNNHTDTSYILNTGKDVILFDKYFVYKSLDREYSVMVPLYKGEFCTTIFSNGTVYSVDINGIEYTDNISPTIVCSRDVCIGGVAACK